MIAVDDAEVVALRIPHPGMGLEPLLDGRAQAGQAVDLRQPVRGHDVEMHGCLRPRLKFDLLEADLKVGSVEDDARIGLRRVAERGEAGDLLVVVGPDVELVQPGRPEPGQRGRRLAIEDTCLRRAI